MLLAPVHGTTEPPEAGIAPNLALAFGGGIGALLVFVVVMILVKRFLFICAPNEILIFSGRKHRLPDGSTVGFKVIQGGRALRLPLLESVSRMDVRLFGVEVSVTNAFSRRPDRVRHSVCSAHRPPDGLVHRGIRDAYRGLLSVLL